MSGGGGGGGTQTTRAEIPEELRPLAREYTSRALDLSNRAYTPYSGQRFSGTAPVLEQANQSLIQNLQGGQTNPYLDALVQRNQQNLVQNYQNVIQPQQDLLAARSGSFGNTGVQAAVNQQQNQLMDQLSGIGTQMYGQAYETDRARQMQALGMAPTLGGLQQQQGQQQLDFNYQQWLDQQNQPYRNLQTLGAPFSLNLGSVTSTSGDGGK